MNGSASHIPIPANFRFPEAGEVRAGARRRKGPEAIRFGSEDLGEDVFRISASSPIWGQCRSLSGLKPDFSVSGKCRLEVEPDGFFRLLDPGGRLILCANHDFPFGVCGEAWLWCLEAKPGMRFYGMGEKNFPFERSGRRTFFWNTDVWSDNPPDLFTNGNPDPAYISIPYLLIGQGTRFTGILVDDPYPAFMVTPEFGGKPRKHRPDPGSLYFGSKGGKPVIYLITGTLAEVTRKLQRLCGCVPRPPLWALGYQQSRWGYKGAADLRRLREEFTRHGIPCSGLWLDIDYMRGFRVFTFDPEGFNDPAEEIGESRDHGFHVVPILDPGIKKERGFPLYDEGSTGRIFCLTPEGREFTGWVWPGETVFPDFSTSRGRGWWARQVARFVRVGVSGAWLDMNEPSVGRVDPDGMCFSEGKAAHSAFHNQYALGMAIASREGFLRGSPGRRPFLVSRAGCPGISRYSGNWTGDNFSNWHHLRQCIPTTLNLALSGIPLNAPDVPGFGGDATPDLAIAWFKACFLFPFFRNHSVTGSRPQEPWAFGRRTMPVLRHFIRLRYKMIPYLYGLFQRQERSGEAILRPPILEFPETSHGPLAFSDDQFMVGPGIMQAPIVEEGSRERKVVLPPGKWYDAILGRWLVGGRTVTVKAGKAETPLFFREGVAVPVAPGVARNNRIDLSRIELHLFLPMGTDGRLGYDYEIDDGISFAYRSGQVSSFSFDIRWGKTGLLIETGSSGNGVFPLEVAFVVYRRFSKVVLHLGNESKELHTTPHSWKCAGGALVCERTGFVRLGGVGDKINRPCVMTAFAREEGAKKK